MFINTIVDLLGIAMLFPLFSILVDDDFLNNPYINKTYHFFGFTNRDSFFIAVCLLVTLIVITKSVIYILSRRYQATFSQEIYQYYTTKMMDHVYNSGYTVIANKNSNELLRDISQIPRALSMFVIMPLLILLNELIVVIIIIGVLIYFYSTLVVLIIVPILLVIYFAYRAIRKSINRNERKLNDLLPRNFKSITDILHGYTYIEVNSRYPFFRSNFRRHIEEEKRARIALGTLTDMPVRIVELGVVISIVIIMVYCYFYIENAGERLYLLGVFGLAAFRITPSLNKILTSVVKIKGHQYILEILGSWKSKDSTVHTAQDIPFREQIKIENLSFAFPDKQLINNINFSITAGKMTGIVGPSGSGKSTFLKLLLGLMCPQSGKILIDDVPLNPHTIENWRRQIGYVGQDVFILDDSIAANIAFGNNNIDKALLTKSIRQAGIEGFINGLPEGTETNIGENGALISGGQKQRIGIARALYKQPGLLILDESTSALDDTIEKEIIKTIYDLQHTKRLTILFVTHKASNLKDADKIIEF